MTTVLRASPRRFVSTPAVERVATRALRYLQSGYSVHLRGMAGTGKTTLALHLADLLTRPIMLVFGDDEFTSADMIGNQSGYTRKKVVDNFIHSVVKVEDELRQTWVDSRLTLACREGFTLVYDEFNRSRPEVNNVLLSALEEKLLVLPPTSNRNEYVRVSSHFRAIFTSNPEEYCGVHATQDALLDRLVTITMPEPDELTQQEILVQKTEINRASALLIVRLIKEFRIRTQTHKSSGLRSGLVIAKVCHEHNILAHPGDVDFRDVCADVLLSRAAAPLEDATKILWELLNEMTALDLSEAIGLHSTYDEITNGHQNSAGDLAIPGLSQVQIEVPAREDVLTDTVVPEAAIALLEALSSEPEVRSVPAPLISELEEAIAPSEADNLPLGVDHAEDEALHSTAESLPELLPEPEAQSEPEAPAEKSLTTPYAPEILAFLQQMNGVRLSEIEQALELDRFQMVDALRFLIGQGKVIQRDRLYLAKVGEA